MSRTLLTSPHTIKIVPTDDIVDHARKITELHAALGPFFAHVKQDLNPRASSRYPFEGGAYTIVFPDWAHKLAMLFVIANHGFSVDPASEKVTHLSDHPPTPSPQPALAA